MSEVGDTHICSLPYGSREQHDFQPSDIHPENPENSSSDAIDIVVYFAESSGLHLRVVDGQNVTASELFEMVMEEQQYPDEARELFSLWLVSDLIELQLKQKHVPFKLVCYWEELLVKYCFASEPERQRDEPVIMFRRNVFCPCDTEKKILQTGSISMLRLIYSEAKKNILTGRYPISKEQCLELAGIQAVINEKETPANEPMTITDFKSQLTNYLPQHYCKRKWLIGTKDNPEFQLHESYMAQRQKYSNARLEDVFHRYIEVCQTLPYYGCAFFRGQVEHGGQRFLKSRVDDPVYVAINLHGVYVIDEDDFVLLLGLPYYFLCWERVEPGSGQDAERLPFLMLQFPAPKTTDGYKSGDTCLLQIFSKQTMLMDKLIETCVALRKSCVGVRQPTDQTTNEQITVGTGEIAKQFQRLALKTVNLEGQLKTSNIRGQRSKKLIV